MADYLQQLCAQRKRTHPHYHSHSHSHYGAPDKSDKFIGPGGIKTATGRIRHVVIIDREVDLLTPMLTQLTYEGILDELFGIQGG